MRLDKMMTKAQRNEVVGRVVDACMERRGEFYDEAMQREFLRATKLATLARLITRETRRFVQQFYEVKGKRAVRRTHVRLHGRMNLIRYVREYEEVKRAKRTAL